MKKMKTLGLLFLTIATLNTYKTAQATENAIVNGEESIVIEQATGTQTEPFTGTLNEEPMSLQRGLMESLDEEVLMDTIPVLETDVSLQQTRLADTRTRVASTTQQPYSSTVYIKT